LCSLLRALSLRLLSHIMGCGCSVAPLSKDQLDTMFDFGARQMMKRCLIAAYAQKDTMKVQAPTTEMEAIRKMADAIHKLSAEIKEKMDAGQDKVAEKIEGAANSATEMAGKLGGGWAEKAVGIAAGAAAKGIDIASDAAASGTGMVLEKILQGLANTLDAAIAAIDEPFTTVGKDIFNAKKNEIIKYYCDIIDGEFCRIKDPQDAVRGAAPWGETEYKACQTDKCVRTMQKQCTAKMQKELHEVVQEEIKKHTVTSAWDTLIKAYNRCTQELNEFVDQYSILKGLEMEPFKLDIGVHIVNHVVIEFYTLMMLQETEIRKNPIQFSKKTDMPELFHLLFSGTPAYDGFNLTHYANMKRTTGVPPDA